jgi:hypothetical protein
MFRPVAAIIRFPQVVAEELVYIMRAPGGGGGGVGGTLKTAQGVD